MIRSLDRSAAMALLDRLLERPPEDMRAALGAWAEENGVLIV
jgi:phosphotransferase system enzyme I (PtsP)